jgi:hypothetical protein
LQNTFHNLYPNNKSSLQNTFYNSYQKIKSNVSNRIYDKLLIFLLTDRLHCNSHLLQNFRKKSPDISLSNVKTLSSPGLIIIIETVAPLQKLDAESKSNWVDESRCWIVYLIYNSPQNLDWSFYSRVHHISEDIFLL